MVWGRVGSGRKYLVIGGVVTLALSSLLYVSTMNYDDGGGGGSVMTAMGKGGVAMGRFRSALTLCGRSLRTVCKDAV